MDTMGHEKDEPRTQPNEGGQVEETEQQQPQGEGEPASTENRELEDEEKLQELKDASGQTEYHPTGQESGMPEPTAPNTTAGGTTPTAGGGTA